MKTLHISVLDKVATYQKRDGFIVCGNSDYQISFTFDEDWNTYDKKTARFVHGGTYTDVVFSGNTCPVPVIRNVTSVLVGVYAGDLNTTTPAEIECQRSILCAGSAPEAPSEDVYAQLMELINSVGTGATPSQVAQIEENRQKIVALQNKTNTLATEIADTNVIIEESVFPAISEVRKAIPTDEYINGLINSALGVIENGTY